MKLYMKKDEFLRNLDNKQWFLEMLVVKMNNAQLKPIQSSGDADLLIAQSATESAAAKPTVVIGEDTDLLVLLLHHAAEDSHTIFLTSEQNSQAKSKVKLWDIIHVHSKLGPSICDAILVVHALLGCDTTSRLFSLGKLLH